MREHLCTGLYWKRDYFKMPFQHLQKLEDDRKKLGYEYHDGDTVVIEYHDTVPATFGKWIPDRVLKMTFMYKDGNWMIIDNNADEA